MTDIATAVGFVSLPAVLDAVTVIFSVVALPEAVPEIVQVTVSVVVVVANDSPVGNVPDVTEHVVLPSALNVMVTSVIAVPTTAVTDVDDVAENTGATSVTQLDVQPGKLSLLVKKLQLDRISNDSIIVIVFIKSPVLYFKYLNY